MPLGNIVETFLSLELGTPQVNWVFSYKMNDEEFIFDDTEMKQELEGISLTKPAIIRYIRTLFEESILEVQQNNQSK